MDDAIVEYLRGVKFLFLLSPSGSVFRMHTLVEFVSVLILVHRVLWQRFCPSILQNFGMGV